MLVDTDVIIWALRGNLKAARSLDALGDRAVCLVTQIELHQGARDKSEVARIKRFLRDCRFASLPLTENIGHRALVYVEEYGLSGSLHLADALIAATATESALPLLTGNHKHYKVIHDLELKRFRP